MGSNGFEGEFPCRRSRAVLPVPADGSARNRFRNSLRVDNNGSHEATARDVQWVLSRRRTGKRSASETYLARTDPCEVYPARIQGRPAAGLTPASPHGSRASGDQRYGFININNTTPENSCVLLVLRYWFRS